MGGTTEDQAPAQAAEAHAAAGNWTAGQAADTALAAAHAAAGTALAAAHAAATLPAKAPGAESKGERYAESSAERGRGGESQGRGGGG